MKIFDIVKNVRKIYHIVRKYIVRFIKFVIFNEKHPLLILLRYDLMDIRIFKLEESHKKMTWDEIEAYTDKFYRKRFGRSIDWENPRSYTEKLNVWKIYNPPSPEIGRLVDKIAVRKWITEKIGSEYLVPYLGVYDKFDDIDFDALPDQFVIKCSHGSGNYTVVKDKSKINKLTLRRKYDIYLRQNPAWVFWEMQGYGYVQRKMIVEQYLGSSLTDYKFICFNGEPAYLWVDHDLSSGNLRRCIYNMDWELMPFMEGNFSNLRNADYGFKRPEQFGELKRIAKILCKDFDHVRVDLYIVDEKIYFGEMTFTSSAGFGIFVPDEWDYKIGELWKFDNSIRAKARARSSKP